MSHSPTVTSIRYNGDLVLSYETLGGSRCRGKRSDATRITAARACHFFTFIESFVRAPCRCFNRRDLRCRPIGLGHGSLRSKPA